MASGGGAAPDLPDCFPPPNVAVSLSSVTVVGSISEADARSALRRIAASVAGVVRAEAAGVERLPTDRCEERRLERNYDACPPVEESTVRLHLQVGPDGRVQVVQPQAAGAVGRAWDGMRETFQRLRFPEADDVSHVTATWKVESGR